MRNLFFTLIFLFAIPCTFGQIVGNNAFAKTNIIELGINECGVFGADSIPADFVNAADPFRSAICDVAGDGWAVGTPLFSGDMTTGSGYDGFYFERSNAYHTVNYVNSHFECYGHDISGNFTNYLNGDDSVTIEWTSNPGYFTMVQRTTIYANKKYIINRIAITNTSTDGHAYYYARELLPAPELYWDDFSTTLNTIEATYVNDGYSLVSAIGSNYNTYFAIGSKNPRCYSAFTENSISNIPEYSNFEQFTLVNPLTVSGSSEGNLYLDVIFYKPALLAGETVNFSYAYIFDESEVEEAINKTNDEVLYTPCVAGEIEIDQVYEGAIAVSVDYHAGTTYELEYAIGGTNDYSIAPMTDTRFWLIGLLEPCSTYDLRLKSMCETDTLYTEFNNVTTLCNNAINSHDLYNIKMYPNPAVDEITIEGLNINEPSQSIIINNASGQIVEKIFNNQQSPTLRINISNYASGLYTVTVISEFTSITKSFVITAE